MAMHKVVTEYTAVEGSGSNIRVFIRSRPVEDDSDPTEFITVDEDRKLVIRDPDPNSNKRYGEVSFQFDRVFWTGAKQDEVFEKTCVDQIDHVLNGYNSCCFAYGQTGSGKTYTMFGSDGEIRGIIPRSIEYLFQALAKRSSTNEVAMVCSFLEIYNDQIRDLGKAYLVAMGVEASTNGALNEKTSNIFENLAGKRGNPYFAPAFHRPGSALATSVETRPGLKEVQDEFNTMNYEIREDNDGNVFVKDLSLVPVTTMDEVMSMISQGLRVRATHETKMNAVSSRSHTVFTINVLQRDKITGQAITGMLNLVDLAGSERIKKSESQGVRLKEALHINTSLTALGKVIMALDSSNAEAAVHVPYRDSKLTRILQNSLGGNSFTSVIAAIHPCPKYYEECLSTLQFANRCRNVRNNPRVNYIEDGAEDKDRRIRKLVEEVNVLRSKVSQLSSTKTTKGGAESGISLTRLVAMLKALGMNASVAPDGGLMINGKKYSLEELGLGEGGSEVHGSAGESSRSSKDPAGGAAAGSSLDKLNKTIKELKENNETLSMRSKERKMQLDEQAKDLQKLSNELVKCKTTIKHKEFEYSTLMEDKERALNELRQVLEAKQREELDALLKANKEMLRLQQIENDRIPTAVKDYTTMVQTMDKQRRSVEAPLRKEFDSHLDQLDRSRQQEIENIKKQYEHFLVEKDKALSGFVEAFNAYRTKKSEQLRMAEREIVRLYDYTEQIEEILDNVEKGKYQVKQKQGQRGGKSTTGMMLAAGGSFAGAPALGGGGGDGGAVFGAIVLPKGLRPMNPLKMGVAGGGGLELTKRIVGRHKQRVARLDKMKEEAFQKSLHYAAQTGATATGNLDDHLRNQVQQLLVEKQAAHRKHSMSPTNKATAAARRSALENAAQGEQYVPMGQQKPMNNRQKSMLRPSTTDLSRPSSFAESPPGSPGTPFAPNSTAPGNLEKMRSRPGTTPAFHASGSLPALQGAEFEQAVQTQAAMVNAELMQELGQLRLQATLEEITTQKVLNDLSKNETFTYIQKLEKDIAQLRTQLQDITQQLQATKVANASLSRLLDKKSAGGGVAGRTGFAETRM